LICRIKHQALANLHMLKLVYYDYYNQFQRLPRQNQGTDELIKQGLLPKTPLDPWKQPYHYILKNNSTHFVICSSGENQTDDHGLGDDLCVTGDVDNALRFFKDKKLLKAL